MLLIQTWFVFSMLLPSLRLISAGNDANGVGYIFSRTKFPPTLGPVTSTPRSPPCPITSTSRSPPCPITYSRDPVASIVLNFSKTGLKTIGDLFVRSPNVIELYLDNNEIHEISPMAFEELTQLEVLQISGNKIPIEKLLWFKTHSTLKSLVIDDNKYNGNDTSIDNILQSLPRLRELSLRRNRISDFNINLKEFAPYLTRLDLSGNSIESVDFLANLPEGLSHLYLNDNAISSVNQANLKNIAELSISGNRITELCSASCTEFSLMLRGMSKLSKLNASRNSISNVAEDTFVDAKRLTFLDLSGNRIRTLSTDIFDKMVFMQELHLSHNLFTSVPKICALARLKHLDLSYNHIAEVANNTFCGLMEIETLLMSNNHIINIDSSAFVTLQSMHTLDLSNNVIAELPVNLITGARYLQVLSLKNNSITSMDQLFDERPSFLKELHLEDNPLLSLRVRHIPQLTVHLKEFKLYDADDNTEASVVLHQTDDPFESNALDY